MTIALSDNGLADAIQKVSKQRAVFCLFDCRKWRAEHANTVSLERTSVRDLDRQVESGLASQRRKQPFGSLALDNALHHLRC